MKPDFTGMGVAMVTPFTSSGGVDYSALQRLTNHLVSNGTNYLVVHGTTGESVVLNDEERSATLEFILENNNKKLPVVLGVGGNDTAEVVRMLDTADLSGVNAILSVSPYYNKPTQEGLYQHFMKVADAAPVPVILYNVPGRTGRNMREETTLRLANDHENIIAIKEASGSFNQIMSIIQKAPAGFKVICGDDAIALPAISVGAVGVISVVGNAYPKEFSQMVALALKGDFTTANKIHYRLLDIIQHLFIESNPSGIKEVLRCLNISGNNTRLPVVPVSDDLAKKIKVLVDQF
ncbi:MAG: 4-hydroxy-tetrahydrodipicolinate synthase [Flavobacteriales bacterium]